MNCLNCNNPVSEGDRFCRNCGQEVDKNNLKLKVLLQKFFENYVSLDTRFGRSIFPFFFKPGKLTLEFIRGARKQYANPFRLYIITSIFFFTLFSIYSVQNADHKPKSEFENLQEQGNKALSNLENMPMDSANKALVKKALQKQEAKNDSTSNTNGLHFSTESNGLQFNMNNIQFQKIEAYRYDKSYTDDDLLDTLGADTLKGFDRLLAEQSIKAYRSSERELLRYLIKNLSFAMFLVMPLSALFLLFFFWKNKMEYAAHLIHSVHLHSLSYVLLGLLICINMFIGNSTLQLILFWLILLYLIFYFYKSLKKVYDRKWSSTIFKGFVLFIIYNVTASAAALGQIIVSFLLF